MASSPLDALRAESHPLRLELYRRARIVFCVGQGAWEDDMLADTRAMQALFVAKEIADEFDYWGQDVNHDWPWWQKRCSPTIWSASSVDVWMVPVTAERLRRRQSPAWRLTWRVAYRFLRVIDPLIRQAWGGGTLGITVDLRVRGRHTGRERAVLLGLLEVAGRQYVGHPNGDAAWVRNLDAAGEARLTWPFGSTRVVLAQRLPDGDERDAVILATAHQQPFPGNLLYRAARGHILAAGAYFRLEPIET